MQWITCPSCDCSKIMQGERECITCRHAQRCEACQKSMSVSAGIHYCPRCNPIRYTVTYEERIGKGTYYEGTTSPEAHREFRQRVQEACERGGNKFTVTLWGETYYHDGEPGTRQWSKIREATIQGNFRQGVIPDLNDYKDQRRS